MDNNCKKGFSLAEMLIVFLLISIMITVFAPVMTKQARKKVDPNCPTGTKKLIAEYMVPNATGNYYTFTVPENITGTAKIILVGGGGKGADGGSGASKPGNGGKGGAYSVQEFQFAYDNANSLNNNYAITVGAGGGKTGYETVTSINGQGLSPSIPAGADGSGEALEFEQAIGGGVIISGSECTSEEEKFSCTTIDSKCVCGQGGAPGTVCSGGSCNPHGKAGSGYTISGLSPMGFLAGTGGGGGGYNGAVGNAGVTPDPGVGQGGVGGDGYVRIEYEIRCNN